jgi:hypothetical protein
MAATAVRTRARGLPNWEAAPPVDGTVVGVAVGALVVGDKEPDLVELEVMVVVLVVELPDMLDMTGYGADDGSTGTEPAAELGAADGDTVGGTGSEGAADPVMLMGPQKFMTVNEGQ